MNWKWKQGSVLNSVNPETPCRDIFKAVCDEIAEYYAPKGWKYARSRPKLTYDDGITKIEMAFWSSGSNWPGEIVNLEIIPAIYSLELKKKLKEKGIKSSGGILGGPGIFYEKLESIPKGTMRVLSIMGDVTEFEEEYEETSVLRHYNNVNVYNLNEDKFMKIIDFINNKIIIWKDIIHDYDKLKERISPFLKSDLKNMKKSIFHDYIEYKFPEYLDDFIAL